MRVAVLTGLTALALAAPASATTYVTASNSASQTKPCDQAKPCDLEWALGQAVTGDDVLLLPGAYAFTAGHTISAGVAIHGVDHGARPVIDEHDKNLSLAGADATHLATLSHVAFTHESYGAAVDLGAHVVVDDVDVTSPSDGSGDIYLRGSDVIVRDSTLRATGTGCTASTAGWQSSPGRDCSTTRSSLQARTPSVLGPRPTPP